MVMVETEGYTRFKAMANRNEHIDSVPELEQIHAAGFSIKPNGYIHGPDGREYNPALANPEIMPDALRRLFGQTPKKSTAKKPSMEIKPDPKPNFEEEQEHQDDGSQEQEGDPKQICDECKQPLPLSDFRKYRGGSHDNVCKSCKKALRKKERKKLTEETTPPDSQQKQTANGWISKQRVKELVSEAYSRGYSDGQADALPEEEEVTLDELLEVADEQA